MPPIPKPRICAIGSSFVRLLPPILSDYELQAEVRIVNQVFAEALASARSLIQAGEVDVFVSAGASGAYLRSRLEAPVVLLQVTGFDILHALREAREVSQRIAIFSFQAIRAELEEVKELLNLDIEQCYYTTPQDARERVKALAAKGFQVIVGSSMITRLAEEQGLVGVFLYSTHSARKALDDAIEIARLQRLQEAQREWLNGILRHLHEGVIAVDMQGRIQSVNPAMERLLGLEAGAALGKPVQELAPGLGLERTLQGGISELERIQRIGNRTVVTHCIPIRTHGAQTGAVLTCQDSSAIQRVDRSLRAQHRPRKFVAKYELDQIVGVSAALLQAKRLAAQYARTDATVLITGESGTGKELLAQGIHNASPRRHHPFVPINCAAFPEALLESELFGYEEGAFTGSRRGGKIGLIESAHTGTLFLDEVGEMPLTLQAKLLRVLQEREVLRLGANDPTPVDVRVVAATNRDLGAAVAAGRFRSDLYYRLNILHLHLPPLRERPEDVPVLAAYLLEQALARLRTPQPALDLLQALLPHFTRYPWPGNVREMENVIERLAVLLSHEGSLDATALPRVAPELFAQGQASAPEEGAEPVAPLRSRQRVHELAYIHRILGECGGNLTQAAARLGVSRTTLWRKLKAGGLGPERSSPARRGSP